MDQARTSGLGALSVALGNEDESRTFMARAAASERFGRLAERLHVPPLVAAEADVLNVIYHGQRYGLTRILERLADALEEQR